MIHVRTIGDARKYVASVHGKLSASLATQALQAATILQREIRTVLYSTVKRGRSGGLARSFQVSLIETRPNRARAGVFSSLSYARIQDEGGTIKPRSVRNLAVPVGRQTLGKWPRNWPRGSLQYIPIKAPRAVAGLFEKRGKKLIPRYWLVPSVQLKPMSYLRRAMTQAAPALKERLRNGVQAAINSVSK